MAKGINGVILGQVSALFDERAAVGLSDGELLGRFLGDEGAAAETAFEVLVRRHGPLVLGVCRRALGDAHRTEDAFQATFLLLAKKARSIRNREAVGAWLAGVASKVAARARGEDLRRRAFEASAALVSRPESPDPEDPEEINALLREVERLRRPLREAVILCHLQGLSYDSAADALGVTEGAIRGRLARARQLLRSRLAGRNLADNPAGFAPITLSLLETVPERLVGSTARASAAVAFGRLVPGIVPGSAITLMEGALKAMMLAKWKTTAMVALAAGLVALGVVARVQAWQKPEFAKPAETPKATETNGETKALANAVDGRIVRTVEVTKDCMVLAYLPDWNYGNVDNIGIGNNGGGVRTLVDWPDVPAQEANSADFKFYLAFYARKESKSNPKPGSILAFEIAGDWSERTSWKALPPYEPEVALTAKFEPGEGWKTFDITPIVRDRDGKSGQGLLFRFLMEDRSGGDSSDYKFVSREGAGEWAKRRPMLLVVESKQK